MKKKPVTLIVGVLRFRWWLIGALAFSLVALIAAAGLPDRRR